MIVFTVGGLNYGRVDRLDTALRGYALRAGAGRVIVDYPQSAAADSIPRGVTALDSAIRRAMTVGPFELLGHSMGAEVISAWLEQHAGADDAPSTEQLQRILLLGNPRRRYGGAWDASMLTSFQFGGVRRTPTPVTQYRTDDIARRGDPWANADNWPNKLTTRDKMRLSFLRLAPIPSPHNNYDAVDIEACRVRAQTGNTRYLVAP